MKKFISLLVIVMTLMVHAEEGVIGTTCSANPQVFATVDGKQKQIFCFGVEKTFFSRLNWCIGKTSDNQNMSRSKCIGQ
jgi:hypothetical protein